MTSMQGQQKTPTGSRTQQAAAHRRKHHDKVLPGAARSWAQQRIVPLQGALGASAATAHAGVSQVASDVALDASHIAHSF